jgi:toxin ParE1/3/4
MRDIWRYTRKTWSQAQADLYVRKLNAAIAELRERPERGRPCDEISPGLHRRSCERHVVFYRVAPRELMVVRVLHQSQDHAAHLAGDDP